MYFFNYVFTCLTCVVWKVLIHYYFNIFKKYKTPILTLSHPSGPITGLKKEEEASMTREKNQIQPQRKI